jgi:hypothetical protein
MYRGKGRPTIGTIFRYWAWQAMANIVDDGYLNFVFDQVRPGIIFSQIGTPCEAVSMAYNCSHKFTLPFEKKSLMDLSSGLRM